mmetsp:Transcript_3455/g.4251  ORF Transcript_3455/g.4251 Transcript_3455/m.4251 type:complete len:96 (+) Transcript_3455:440-727(+)
MKKRNQKIENLGSDLDSIVNHIDNMNKKVNCLQKTELDWNEYISKNGIKEDLEKNRKGGFIAKKRFLDKVSETEYQHKKTAEKEKIQQQRNKEAI